MDTFESLNDSVWERKYHSGVHAEVSAEDAARDLRERRLYENLYPFCVRSAGGLGPEPHPGFIEVSCEAPVR
jgi:hypothetical protein